MKREWWAGTGLNRRHQDFQSCALPTELPAHQTRQDNKGARDCLFDGRDDADRPALLEDERDSVGSPDPQSLLDDSGKRGGGYRFGPGLWEYRAAYDYTSPHGDGGPSDLGVYRHREGGVEARVRGAHCRRS